MQLQKERQLSTHALIIKLQVQLDLIINNRDQTRLYRFEIVSAAENDVELIILLLRLEKMRRVMLHLSFAEFQACSLPV